MYLQTQASPWGSQPRLLAPVRDPKNTKPSPAHPLAKKLLRGFQRLLCKCMIGLISVPQTSPTLLSPGAGRLKAPPTSPPPKPLLPSKLLPNPSESGSAATSPRRAAQFPPNLDSVPASASPAPALPLETQGTWPVPAWLCDTPSTRLMSSYTLPSFQTATVGCHRRDT